MRQFSAPIGKWNAYDQLVGIGWQWQSLDSASIKSPLGSSQTGKNPTDRGKLGTRRHVLTDQQGVPIAGELLGAHRHDMKMTLTVIDSIVVEPPEPEPRCRQHLCLDKGYDYLEIDRGVKRTHSWYNRLRTLLVRFETYDENYLALVDFASALIVYRTLLRLSHQVLGQALNTCSPRMRG